jgi:hypothetical protein
MDENRREAWNLYKYGDWSQGVHLTVKEKIAALKLLKECNEAKFALLDMLQNLRKRENNREW